MSNVTIKNRKTGEVREDVTRTAANALSRRWYIVGEPDVQQSKGKSPNVPAPPAQAARAGGNDDELEILKGLQDQYKQLTGKEASKLWSESTLMEQIQFALDAGSDNTGQEQGLGAAEETTDTVDKTEEGDEGNG